MNVLRYTLIADGTSDRCLMKVIDWVIAQKAEVAEEGFVPQFADLSLFRETPTSLSDRIVLAVQQFPCDLLLIHRDAENQGRDQRIDEINRAVRGRNFPPHVAVVPVRMTEAWLLLDAQAIRTAADNPNGQVAISLPRLNDLEELPDPKDLLWSLLVIASELSGRRRDQFSRARFERRQRVAELIRDFSPLRRLSAFKLFEDDLNAALDDWLNIVR